MKYTNKLILFLITLISLIASNTLQAQEQQQQLLDASSIYLKAMKKWDLTKRQYSYSYKRLQKNSDISNNGNVSKVSGFLTENYNPVIAGDCDFDFALPFILLERNGKPLAADNINKQRNEVAKQLARYEETVRGLSGRTLSCEQKAEKLSGDITTPNYRRVIDYSTVYSSFSNLHKEKFNGRECYVFLARPRDNLDVSRLGFLAMYDAIYWIGIDDNAMVRRELYEKGQAANFIGKPMNERELATVSNARVMFIENEKLWVLEYVKIQYRNKSGRVFSTTEDFYSDYKFYKTEVTDAHIDSPAPEKP